MSKGHFFLYDFLLPILVALGAGWFLSQQLDTALFRWLDSVKAFGFGSWFGHSPLRTTLWDFSWVAFAVPPALLWLVWVRMNVEYDYVERRRRLDRPVFGFVRGFFRWIESDESARWQLQSAQFRAAQAEDRARQLESDLHKAKAAYTELAADYDALEEETASLQEMEDQYQAGAKAG